MSFLESLPWLLLLPAVFWLVIVPMYFFSWLTAWLDFGDVTESRRRAAIRAGFRE